MKKINVLLALILFFIISLSNVSFSEILGIPAGPSNYVLLDQTNSLNQETINFIIRENDVLWNYNGGEVVFLIMDFIPFAQDIADFAHAVFNDWGIGSVQNNNGILVLIARQEPIERGIWILGGDGISQHMPSSAIQSIISSDFAPYFENEFDNSVINLFNSLSQILYNAHPSGAANVQPIPNINTQQTITTSESNEQQGIGVWPVILIIIFAMLIIIIIASSNSGSRNIHHHHGGMHGGLPRRRGGFMSGLFLGSMMGGRRRRGANVVNKTVVNKTVVNKNGYNSGNSSSYGSNRTRGGSSLGGGGGYSSGGSKSSGGGYSSKPTGGYGRPSGSRGGSSRGGGGGYGGGRRR